jgi:hypothetical protein
MEKGVKAPESANQRAPKRPNGGIVLEGVTITHFK